MKWSQEQRLQFLGSLDSIDRVLTGIYRWLMVLIILCVLIGSGWVLVRRPIGPGNQGEYFYFSVAALLAIVWAVGQYVQAGRRQRRRLLSQVTVDASDAEGGRAWRVQFGPAQDESATSGAASADFSASFSLPLANVAAELLPDGQALACFEAELARGVDLDAACQTIQPAYENWGTLKRRAYQMYVKNRLDGRRHG